MLLEPIESEARVFINIADEFVQRLGEHLVDLAEGGAHRQGLAIGFQHAAVTRINRHAGSDAGLRQIDRQDLARAHFGNGGGQFGAQGIEEAPARCGGGVDRVGDGRPARLTMRVRLNPCAFIRLVRLRYALAMYQRYRILSLE